MSKLLLNTTFSSIKKEFPILKCDYKKVHTREIKQRGFQRKNIVKYGAKAEQFISFGNYILIPGTLYTKNITIEKLGIFKYFYDDYVLIGENIFRKGCRPNTRIEMRMKDNEVVLVAMAIRNINVNEEVVLPIDYGNKDEEISCICSDMKLCLK